MLRTTEHVAAQNCNIEDQLKHLSGVVSDLKEFIMQQQRQQEQPTSFVGLPTVSRRTQFSCAQVSQTLRQPINVIATPTLSERPAIPNIPACLHPTIFLNMEYWLTNKYWAYLSTNDVSKKK